MSDRSATGEDMGAKRKPSTQSESDESKKRFKSGDSKGSVSQDGLATVEGQLSDNPELTLDEAKSKAKREYHRQNAARTRVRNKVHVEDLEQQVGELNKHTAGLERENEVLKAQLHVLMSHQAQHRQPQQQQQQQAYHQDFAGSVMALLQNNQQQIQNTSQNNTAIGSNDPNAAAAQFAQFFATQMQQQRHQQLHLQQQQYQQAANAMNQLLAMSQITPQNFINQGPRVSDPHETNNSAMLATFNQFQNQGQQGQQASRQDAVTKQDQEQQRQTQQQQKHAASPSNQAPQNQVAHSGLHNFGNYISQTRENVSEMESMQVNSKVAPPMSNPTGQVVQQQQMQQQQAIPLPQVQNQQMQQMMMVLQQQNPGFAQMLGQIPPEMLNSILLQMSQAENGGAPKQETDSG